MNSQQPLDPHALGRVHLIGMGGAGMSAVARLLLARGVPVSGSDAKDSAGLRDLESLGATVFVGQDAAHVAGASTVVVSTAIREQNPELAAARGAGLRVLHRSQALAAAMHGRRVIAVAGTHGKTTTSSMTAVALRAAGLRPSWAIGAHVADLGANAGFDAGEWFVAEADESDGSFMAYHPEVAVVTNVEPDHLDHYGSAEAFHRAFDEFSDTIREGGTLVACADDPGAARLAERRRARGGAVLSYGTDPGADVVLSELTPHGTGTTCRIGFPVPGGRREALLELAVPGAHNAADAAAAFAAGCAAGADPEQLLAGLADFHGSARRFDLKGEQGGVRVFDDYAHHPTEVAAALGAARDVAGGRRVLAIFQPHLYSRTREFAEAFCRALELADLACVTDVFGAREQPEPGITGATITGHARNGRVVSTPATREAVEAVVARAEPGDVVMTVGAGDVTTLGPQVLAALARH
ncbi:MULTISPECIES: UDP-N-acetylmuramate--L-alanine ligase [Kocuria]|uniref:UDP-N-acetylmuramate--L-alanine ligase n=1 Tax=Kocuria TaxID=57493 RepID=UPI000DD3A15F|nr:UDP-N-acetylmuramate--L-alanine ligase [Kocuria sp. BT304]